MRSSTRPGRAIAGGLLLVSALALAACSASGSKSMTAKNPRSLEYFSESEYGVKASPRVSNKRSNLPRGGGRDQLGKPYQVRGKWYYPKEDKSYRKVGGASWYGDAFHGRLTANGEIYDMTHLTAAHPTMPLPSYARVTNTSNGSSVIVRVNDRGPYADGRIIDLSRKAAEMLDYTHDGVATVKVEYVGRAPLEGRDDSFLLASYRPGGATADPLSDGLPTGVMIAMNGPQPSGAVAAAAFPGQLNDRPRSGTALAAADERDAISNIVLPEIAPIAAPRPGKRQIALATLGYATEGQNGLKSAFAAMKEASSGDAAWKRSTIAAQPSEFVAVGTFQPGTETNELVKQLSVFGRVDIQQTADAGTIWQSVSLYTDGRFTVDEMLRAAWDNGAMDAMTVHD
ncbi:MAG TPA: septal ring lytic transglycosylase RlpA family protein [Mesorhizobium sp.]